MMHTNLTTLPVHWDAIQRGDKTFDVRKNDRDFQVGDEVTLLRWEDGSIVMGWRGSVLKRRIRYIQTGGQFGIEPGYVVLQLEDAHA
jgi:hypothetical protein